MNFNKPHLNVSVKEERKVVNLCCKTVCLGLFLCVCVCVSGDEQASSSAAADNVGVHVV